MAVKLIAADMDGTLLTSDQRITRRTEDAIKKAIDNGIEFILGTGRSNSECAMFYHQLPLRYSIFANGAYVRDLKNKTDIITQNISVDEAKIIYDIYAKYDSIIFIQGDHWVYTSYDFLEKCRRFPEYTVGFAPVNLPYRFVDDLKVFLDERNGDIEKFHVSFFDPEDGKKAYDELIKLPFKVVWCGKYCVEVTHPGADKGRALGLLAERLGIKQEEVMAIGDSENDASMLEYAGISVVVDNAPDKLKAKADIVVPSHDEDGVVVAIEMALSL